MQNGDIVNIKYNGDKNINTAKIIKYAPIVSIKAFIIIL